MQLSISLIWTALYYLLFVPVSLALRIFRRDKLQIDRASDQPTYWVDRAGHRYSDMTGQG